MAIKGIEFFRKLKTDIALERAKLSGELDKLKSTREQLDNEINQAIDEGKTEEAEKLLAKQHDLDLKIEITQRTIDRKAAKQQDPEAIIAAANATTAQYQKKIDLAGNAVLAAKKDYLSKLIDRAILINEAWAARTDYCKLLDVEDPTTDNAETHEFSTVAYTLKWDRLDKDLILEINPRGLEILAEAGRNHYNGWIGRDNEPRTPEVVISKY